MSGPDNNVAASPNSRFRGNQWKAYDELPRELRFALQEAVVDWCAIWLRWEFKKLVKGGHPADEATLLMADRLVLHDQMDIDRFAQRFARRFGRYPHRAAGVSPVTYREAERVRSAGRAS